MTPVKGYRDLIAWQRARELAAMVYECAGRLPQSEAFGLSLQLRRSAVSVASNIAEGFGRTSRQDFVRFLRVARGSLCELSTQLTLTEDLGLATVDSALKDRVEETDRVLAALIRSIQRRVQS